MRAAGGILRAGSESSAVLPERPRILLIRPDHLGDVILTSPAVELLRTALPDSHLTMIVGPWSEEVARRDPLLDSVTVCRFPGFAREEGSSLLNPYLLLRDTAREVRRARYDAALVLRDDHWWGAWLAAQAGVPVRAGHAVAECRPFLNATTSSPPGTHWVERSLAVVRRAIYGTETRPAAAASPKPLRFIRREEDEAKLGELLAAAGLDTHGGLVALHPGAGSPMKLWLEERWVEFGNRISARGVTVVVTGSASEAGMAQRIAAGITGAVSLAGRTDLGTLGALFRRCALVAGTDNGPLHLAIAVDTPSIRLFGPVDPAVYGPWGDPRRHVALTPGTGWTPCGRLDRVPADGRSPACMRAISVDTVYAESMRLLGVCGR